METKLSRQAKSAIVVTMTKSAMTGAVIHDNCLNLTERETTLPKVATENLGRNAGNLHFLNNFHVLKMFKYY